MAKSNRLASTADSGTMSRGKYTFVISRLIRYHAVARFGERIREELPKHHGGIGK